MKSKIYSITKKAAAFSYSLGAVCLVAGILLSIINVPASAAGVRDVNCPHTSTPVIPTETKVIAPTATDTQVVLPSDTPVIPTATHTDVPADTATATSPIEVLPPVPSDTAAPTATTAVASPEIILPPVEQTNTPTNTSLPPSSPTPTATDHPRKARSTATPYTLILPPVATWTPGVPATLPPPSQPTQQGQKPVLIPQTGAVLTVENGNGSLPPTVFLKLGIGLLGLALVFHGISSKNR